MINEFMGYLILNNRKLKLKDFDQKVFRALVNNATYGYEDKRESIEVIAAFGNSFDSKYGIQVFDENTASLEGNYANFSVTTKNLVDTQGISIPSRGCAIYSAWCGGSSTTIKDNSLLKEKIPEATVFDNQYPSLLLSRLNSFKQKDTETLHSYADNVDKHIIKPLRGTKRLNLFSTAVLYLGNHPNCIFISTNKDFSIYFHYLCVRGLHILLWSSNPDLATDLLYRELYADSKITSFLHELFVLSDRRLILNFNFLVKNKYWSWVSYYKSKESCLYVVSSLQRFLNAMSRNNRNSEASPLQDNSNLEDIEDQEPEEVVQ